jgi:small-conductance mechanosensitive channel
MNIVDTLSSFGLSFESLSLREVSKGVLSTFLIVFLILVLFKLSHLFLSRALKGRISDQRAFLIRKLFRYAGFTVAAMTVFNRIGIDLSAILGAAGILGIAIGFAAQTSVSNVISGLFLISEKPFVVGDVIQVGDAMGSVLSIDFLSIKIQTFDNRFIRIPNETIIKTNVVNITRFPIRRLDVWITVSYKENLEKVKAVLEDVAKNNLFALDNPEPLIVLDKFDASGINILFGLWFEKSNFLNLKNSIMWDVKKRFDQEHITIPYPQLDVRLGGKPAGD